MSCKWVGAAVLVASVVLAGCGGGSSTGPSAAERRSWPAFAQLSHGQIESAVTSDMGMLSAVHYRAAGSLAGGQGFSADVQADSAGDCTGSVGSGPDGTVQLIGKNGTTWFKGDAVFWKHALGDRADSVMVAIGDKWLEDSKGLFTRYCDLDQFVATLMDPLKGSSYTVQGVNTRQGQEVVKVALGSKSDPVDGFVLVTGKHYFTTMSDAPGAPYGAIDFSDFDKAFKVRAPAPGQVFQAGTPT